jgi:hypothetical protein
MPHLKLMSNYTICHIYPSLKWMKPHIVEQEQLQYMYAIVVFVYAI